MPERIIIPLPKTCKYDNTTATKNKNEPIKIDTSMSERTKKHDKEFNKKTIGKEKPTFTDFIIEIDNEQDCNKMINFIEYCHLIEKCVHCFKKVPFENFKSNDYNEIEIFCSRCYTINVDDTKQSKDYVRWYNNLVEVYGISFKDGFPKAMRAEWGDKCDNCGGKHNGGGYEFYFFED